MVVVVVVAVAVMEEVVFLAVDAVDAMTVAAVADHCLIEIET
jgi:hypothetical protein